MTTDAIAPAGDDPAPDAAPPASTAAPEDAPLGPDASADDEPPVSPGPERADLATLQAAVADPAPSAAATPATPATPASQSPASPSPASPATPRAPAPRRERATTEDDEGPRPRRRWPLIVAALATAAVAITTLVVLGQVHAGRYALRCGATTITAERGRSFPPWGFARIGGPAWRPIAIPPGAECTSHETEDVVELEAWFLEHLTGQATAKLEGEVPGDLDRAEAELDQALLLARSPERRDLRKELERLRGDVTYWRAAARVKAAAATLDDAARAFDDAAAQRPRHASDPGRWATFVRSVAATLVAGPDGTGAPPPTPSTPTRPMAPPGIALPVEPTAAEVPLDAGVEPDASRRDLPSGGVLM